MSIIRHGISLGIERIEQDIFFSMKIKGKLTHEDYQHIIPLLESALIGVTHPKINMYIDASELEGWELHAAWDDLKLGIKHGNEIGKVAILGSKKWQKYATKVGRWFISGEAKYFENSEDAFAWINR